VAHYMLVNYGMLYRYSLSLFKVLLSWTILSLLHYREECLWEMINYLNLFKFVKLPN
jgi:hypothetical protein